MAAQLIRGSFVVIPDSGDPVIDGGDMLAKPFSEPAA